MTAAEAGPRGRSFCDLMGGAMSPLATALARFGDLFEAHLAGGCPIRRGHRDRRTRHRPSLSTAARCRSAGRDLLTACLEAGIEVPHFCWHGALGSAGACRLCAVTVTDGTRRRARIEMSCMTRALDGQRVGVADPEAAEFRAR
jgi:ferredoxin